MNKNKKILLSLGSIAAVVAPVAAVVACGSDESKAQTPNESKGQTPAEKSLAYAKTKGRGFVNNLDYPYHGYHHGYHHGYDGDTDGYTG